MPLFRRTPTSDHEVPSGHWFVVHVRLADGTECALVADHPMRALEVINRGEGPKETRGTIPAVLIGSDEYMNLEDAKRHCAVARGHVTVRQEPPATKRRSRRKLSGDV